MIARLQTWIRPSCAWALVLGCCLAVVAGALLDLPGKWAAALGMALALLVALPLVRPRPEHWIGAFFLVLDLPLNIYLAYFTPMHDLPHRAKGIFLMASDIPLVMLLISALLLHVPGVRRMRFRPFVPVFIAVALITAAGMVRSRVPIVNQVGTLLLQARVLMYAVVVVNTVTSASRARWALGGLLVSVGLNIGLAFLQLVVKIPLGLGVAFSEAHTLTDVGTVTRIGGIIGTQSAFAKFLGINLPLALSCLFVRNQPRRYYLALWLIVLAGIGADILTFSRGGWVGLTVGFLIVLGIGVKRRTGRFMPALVMPVALGLLSVAVILVSPVIRARVFGNDQGTSKDRVSYMRIATSMIADHPLLGVGFGWYVPRAFAYDRTENLTTYFFRQPVHNEYLLMAAEHGIVPLLIYLGIVLVTVRMLMRTSRKSESLGYPALGVLGGLCAYWTQDLFEWSWAYTMVNLWSRVALGHALCYVMSNDEGRDILALPRS